MPGFGEAGFAAGPSDQGHGFAADAAKLLASGFTAFEGGEAVGEVAAGFKNGQTGFDRRAVRADVAAGCQGADGDGDCGRVVFVAAA
jgi:hypothetical protein